MPKNYDVRVSDRGGWDVIAEGGARASSHHSTETDAREAARRYAANAGGGDVRVHDEAGNVTDTEAMPGPGASAAASGGRQMPTRGIVAAVIVILSLGVLAGLLVRRASK